MIKVGIYGFGNVAKGVLDNCAKFPDIKIVAIFSRHAAGEIYANVPIYSTKDVAKFRNKIDVMLICVGSRLDAQKTTEELLKHFNTVDCFDDHMSMEKYFYKMKKIATENQHLAICATGWDPGLFSIARCVFDSILPTGRSETFWGKGISQGHSEAVRKLDGVIDARQYTIPNMSAVKSFEKYPNEDLPSSKKHIRLCYVAVKDGTNKAEISDKIKNMPHYFKGYITKIKFVSKDTIKLKHSKFYHQGFVERIEDNVGTRHMLKLNLQTDSNPSITGLIMLAYARANYRLYSSGQIGAKTVLDICPRLLCEKNDFLKFV